MNILDWLIVLLIAAAVFFAVKALKGKKSGCCPGSCSGCPHRCPDAEKSRK